MLGYVFNGDDSSADKDTAMDTDVTAITAVMEATTEVMVNTEFTVTMARWKKVRRTSLAV